MLGLAVVSLVDKSIQFPFRQAAQARTSQTSLHSGNGRTEDTAAPPSGLEQEARLGRLKTKSTRQEHL